MARNFADWVGQYVEYTSYLEAPTSFHIWTAIGTIAGALRGKCFIDMHYFRWKPNFFVVFVAPPGVVSKSTTLGLGMELLRGVEGVIFGPESATWQAMTEAFIESELPVPEIGSSMSALTIVASELGTFFDPKNREMIDVLNDLWDGRNVPWKRRTKGEGATEIHNPWLNFLGCTTPAWIKENFPQYAIGGGFTSRTVFVWGEHKRRLIAYPTLEVAAAGEEFKKMKPHLVNDLKQIAKLAGQYHLTDAAMQWGEAWYEQHWTVESPDVDRDIHGGYVARKQTHIHKVAMVLAASQGDTLVIDVDHLQAAAGMVTDLEVDFGKIFAAISDNKEVHQIQELAAVLRRYPSGIPVGQLYKKLQTRMTWQQFQLASESLIAAEGMVKSQNGQTIILRPGITAKLIDTSGQTLSRSEAHPPVMKIVGESP